MTLLDDASYEISKDKCPHCNGKGYTDWDKHKATGECCEFCECEGYILRCYECKNPLTLVRPGKWQCDYCGW